MAYKRVMMKLFGCLPQYIKFRLMNFFAPQFMSEIEEVEVTNCSMVQIAESQYPLLQVNEKLSLVSKRSNKKIESLIEPILEKKLIPLSHSRVFLDFVMRYKHSHMQMGFDTFRGRFGALDRRIFHPQHFAVRSQCSRFNDSQHIEIRKVFYPENNWTILDVGCYTGLGSLFFAKNYVTRGKVISVEAVRENFMIACKNKEINEINNWTILNKAVWNRDSVDVSIDILSDQADFRENLTARDSTEIVQTITIQTLCEKFGPVIDLLSLTINGAEIEAIETIADLQVDRRPRRILAPGWYKLAGDFRSKIIAQKLEYIGYTTAVTPENMVYAWQ